MGLFTVVCETCQARLTVRERSLIGQIVECPKCGSMVGIFPPPGWTPSADSAAEPKGEPPATSQPKSSASSPTRPAESNGQHRASRDSKASTPTNHRGQAPSAGTAPSKPPWNTASQPAASQPAASRTDSPKSEKPPQTSEPRRRSAPAEAASQQPKQKTSPAPAAPTAALGASLAQVADVGLDLTSAAAPALPAKQRGQATTDGAATPASEDGFGDSLDEWAVERGSGHQPDPLAELDNVPDWYVANAARRWIWISAAAAASLLLVIGTWLVFRGSDTPQEQTAAVTPAPAEPSEPVQPIEQPQDNTPADQPSAEPSTTPDAAALPPVAGEAPTAPEVQPPPRDELPEVPAVWEPRWLPPTTAAVLTIRPGALASQPLFPAELASAAPEQWRLIGPIVSAFGLEPHEIDRITWAVVEDQFPNPLNPRQADGPLNMRRSVIAIRLVDEAKPAAERLAKSPPLDMKLGTIPCRMLENSPWPFPFAMVQEQTILTGPSDLLQSLHTVDGTPGGLRSQPLQTLLAKITPTDQFAGVIDNRTRWLAQVPATWLPVGPARVAWGRLAKAPAVGFALRTSGELAARLYVLGNTNQEAATLTGDVEAILAALTRMSEPPVWWPKLPGDAAPAAVAGPAPATAGVDLLAQVQAVQGRGGQPGSAFDVPGLIEQPKEAAGQQGENGTEAGPQPLTGSQVWLMLHPLWKTAKASTENSVAEVSLALKEAQATEPSLALFTLARNEAEDPQLADAGEPAPRPDPQLQPADEPEPEPLAPQVDIAARLRDPVAGVGFQQVAWADALDVFSELSQIPLAFDFAAIQAAGAAPGDLIDLSVKDTTVAGAIEALLAKKKLRAIPQDRYLLITADPPQNDQPQTQSYPVDDLVTPAQDAQTLAALVRRFIAPQSWQNGGGQGTIVVDGSQLRVEQPAAIQRQVARFLDQLRAARGKSPRTGIALPQLPLQTPYAAAARQLSKQVTANFVDAAPLRQVLRYLQAQSGVRVVLDAASLPETIWAERPVKLSATEEPMAAVIAKLADSLGVGLRIIDANTIEFIGSDRLAAEMETAFYPLTGQTGAEPAAALADRVRREVQPEKWNQPTNPPAIAVDEPSQTLIVRQDQATLVAIELWLQEQRKPKQ